MQYSHVPLGVRDTSIRFNINVDAALRATIKKQVLINGLFGTPPLLLHRGLIYHAL